MVATSEPLEITPPSPSSSVPPPTRSSAVSATLSPTTARTRIRMAPMSPTYDRLEAGRPPAKHSKRFGWKKFALGAGLLLALVWLFVPKEKRTVSLPTWGGSPTFEKGNTPYEGKPPQETADLPPMRPSTKTPVTPPPNHADEDIRHPESFDADADPSKTTYCTTPHYSADRLVQYGLMLDAGSTGSRIHIYKFNNCGSSPKYEYEVFKMTQPGLSSFADRPSAAAASLDVLMDEAMRVVPVSLRKCTPIAVKATAGLRLLPGSQAADILAAVDAHLRNAYPFALTEGSAVMDGADEGVFAWVTANYLLHALDTGAAADAPTVAVLDLGGASTQIVFAPTAGAPMVEGDHKYALDFQGKTRMLYQHSYLGYGLMRARGSVHRLVDFMADAAPGVVVSNPCLAQGTQRTVDITTPEGKTRKVVMDGGEVGGFDACARLIALVLAKDAVCTVRPCAFGGVYQPPLSEAFPAMAGRVLLLSYFYDRVAPLVPVPEGDDPLTASVDGIADLARAVCKGRDEWLSRWGTQTTLMAELEDRPEWCLDLTFMHGLLRTGYEFDGAREVLFGKKIAGTELGWCLGAGIKLVGGVDVQCQV
ncbi:nucleoside phosphatase family-domain-containing protein [Mycena epipterygia]|nr:nucleoside phosphatase family-domain-containing protein [Mycena epipterygia]